MAPSTDPPAPLLVAGADTLLLRQDHPDADRCRRSLARFAQLERSPGLVDTYRLTDLGLWNAKASGLSADEVLADLQRFAGGPVPGATALLVTDAMARYGPIRLVDGSDHDGSHVDGSHGDGSHGDLVLRADTPELLEEILADPEVAASVDRPVDEISVSIRPIARGALKLALTRLRWPADDRAILHPGTPIDLALAPSTELRPYQRAAVDGWRASGTGVVVLPCGAGKTVVALAAAAETGTTTLVLATSGASLDQWERELRRFTTASDDQIGRYGAGRRDVRPITLATYQMLATRRDGRFHNLALIEDHDWGLVIYDEVHLLPAAVFGLSAAIQARRRLGLTATLVREDGRESDVFTLIGPRRYDVPWSDLELDGWIAPARCTEIRIVPSDEERMAHARQQGQARARVAAGIGAKIDVVGALLRRHRDEPSLVIGTYLDGLRAVADRHQLELVTGETPERQRIDAFDRLRRGQLSTLVVSRVGNYSIDLPEVSVAIQVSGTFGSRQEEAQRLGRLLRPKADGRQAHFYTLVARDTVEQEHSARRQRFLAEQGYHYEVRDAEEFLD